MLRGALREQAATLGLDLSDGQLGGFEAFESALYEANESMNLTRIPREQAWLRHFLDSLLFHRLIPHGSSVLDIGSGPGFPAWPLANARPDLQVTALDSSGKMLGFLRTQPLPNLEVIQDRAETWQVRDQYDVVTGRALAPIAIQLELSAPPCRIGGIVLPMRTEADRAEIDRLATNPLGLELRSIERRELPVVMAPRLFPIFEKRKRTPSMYPRPWADIRRKPL